MNNSAAPITGVPPRLGTPVPGTTGGLPAQRGLSVNASPMARQLQSMGRGDDKMLVHMTPDEVGGLQQLALASGGSLTINPQTGLPEAGWLGKLLPTLLGIAGAAIGLPTWAIGLGVGAGGTAVTGDLGKGLAMGLQAFGGAGIGQAAGLGGEISKNAFGLLGDKAATSLAPTGAGAIDATMKSADMSGLVPTATAPAATAPTANAIDAMIKSTDMSGLANMGGGAANAATNVATTAPKGFLGKFAQETAIPGIGGIGKTLGPAMAGSAVLSGISDAFQPKVPKLGDEEEGSWNYEGPYVPSPRDVSFQSGQQMRDTGGAEYQYFTPSNPVPGYRPVSSLGAGERDEYGFAEGGSAEAGLGQIPVDDFQQLTQFFQASRPGAITASMYPPMRGAQPSAPAPGAPTMGGEATYNFNRPTQSPIAPGGIPGMGGGFDFSNIDLSGIDLSGINFGGLNAPTEQRLTPDYYRGGIEIPASAPAPVPSPTPYTPPAYTPPAIMAQQPVPDYSYSYTPPAYYEEETFADREGPGGLRQEQRMAFARGGPIDMKDGAFVVDARTVSELGNGSSNAGMEMLARMGGRPLHGPGDGVSDSIPARIGGRQEARVARDEVVFPPEAVRRIGKGSEARGTKKLYALMDKAHKARKNAKRGEDTGLRKGLA